MGLWDISLWQLVLKGGPLVIPIILFSLLGLAIIIEKFMYFSSISTNIADLKENVFQLIKNNHIKKAIVACDQNASPVAKVLKAGLIKFDADKIVIREAMEEASLFELPKLERRLSGLSTIANVTPLIGLLGTVTGMTGSFHTISVQSSSVTPVTPGDLAGGIWEALLTTVFGLAVAIPAFIAHSYFMSRVNQMTIEIEHAATELMQLAEQGSVLNEKS